jgi:hypothetical protein
MERYFSSNFLVKEQECSLGGLWGGLYQAKCLEALSSITSSKVVTLNTQIADSLKSGSEVQVNVEQIYSGGVEQYLITFTSESKVVSTTQAICGYSLSDYDKQFSKMPAMETVDECNEMFFFEFTPETDILKSFKTKWPSKKPDGVKDKLFWVKYLNQEIPLSQQYSIISDVSCALLGMPFKMGDFSYLLSVSSHYNREVESEWYLASVEYISANENFLNMRTKLYSSCGTLVCTSTSTSVITTSRRFEDSAS